MFLLTKLQQRPNLLTTHLHFLGCRSQHQCEKNRSRERHGERERWIECARNGALKTQRDPKKRDNDPPSRYLPRSLQVPAVTTYPHNRLAVPINARGWICAVRGIRNRRWCSVCVLFLWINHFFFRGYRYVCIFKFVRIKNMYVAIYSGDTILPQPF
jgi:hypothetical protein